MLAGDEIAQYIAWPDRRQLIHITDQVQMRRRVKCLNQPMHQRQVDHGGLIHDDNVYVKSLVGVEGKAKFR